VLTRETFVIVVPLAALWVWWPTWRSGSMTRSAGRARVAAAVLVATAAIPAIAWSAAQSVRHERVIVIADKAREVFDAGHNPRANGTYNEPLVGIGEPAGFAYIRAEPVETIRLSGRKLLYMFGVLRDGWNVPQPPAVWLWRASTGLLPLTVLQSFVSGGWLLLTCVIGLVVLGPAWIREWWVLPATAGAILAVHVATLGSFRFNVPLLPVWYILASAPVATVVLRLLGSLRMPVVSIACAVLIAVVVGAQFKSWPLAITYQAADLDGLAARNVFDPALERHVRVAEASKGERPIVLLPDTQLPIGRLRVTTRLRLASAVDSETSVARAALVQLDGRPACVADITAAQLTRDAFTDIVTLCELERDGPATFALFARGQGDLVVESVRFAWGR
jgi:hypothetical protein